MHPGGTLVEGVWDTEISVERSCPEKNFCICISKCYICSEAFSFLSFFCLSLLGRFTIYYYVLAIKIEQLCINLYCTLSLIHRLMELKPKSALWRFMRIESVDDRIARLGQYDERTKFLGALHKECHTHIFALRIIR